MILLRVHRIFMLVVIAGCVAFAAHEIVHAAAHSALRAAVGIALPALLAGAIAAYVRYLGRKIRVTEAEAALRAD